MSSEALAWAKGCCGAGSVPQLILILMADWADHEDRAWPGIKKLAALTGRSERTIIRAIKRLEDAGLIEKSTRSAWCALDNPACMSKGPHKHRTSNVYKLNVGARPGSKRVIVDEPSGDVAADRCEPETAQSCGNPISDKMSLLGSISDKTGRSIVTPVSPVCNSDLPENYSPDLTSCEQARDAGRGAGVGSGFDGEAERGGEATAAVPPALPEAPSAPCPAGGPLEPDDSWVGPVPREALDALEADVERAGGASGAIVGAESATGGPRPRRAVRTDPGGSSADDGLLVAACLPPALQALDRQGAHRVAQMLRVRLDAGWAPGQIRQLMDQRLPSRVHRLAALVAARLEANVDPQAAPERLREQAEKAGRERLAALRASQDRQVEALVDDVVDAEFEALLAQVAAEMPDASWATWTRIAMDRRGEGGASA